MQARKSERTENGKWLFDDLIDVYKFSVWNKSKSARIMAQKNKVRNGKNLFSLPMSNNKHNFPISNDHFRSFSRHRSFSAVCLHLNRRRIIAGFA